MNWERLLEEADLASALPEVYAHYRRPLQAALAVFLEGLPAARQEAIAVKQAALPATATASERLALLARSCPVLHKLGQTLARDRNLSPSCGGAFSSWSPFPPPFPTKQSRGCWRKNSGRWIAAKGLARLDLLPSPQGFAPCH